MKGITKYKGNIKLGKYKLEVTRMIFGFRIRDLQCIYKKKDYLQKQKKRAL